MSFSLNTNVSALNANINNNLHSNNLNNSIGSLASGSAINKAADDASGLTIADQLSAQVKGLGQAMMNINDSIGMTQIADGAMQGISDNADRINVLMLKASNATMSSSDRAMIQQEIDGLMESSNRIINQTSYNGQRLLSDSGNLITHSGANSGETQGLDLDSNAVKSLVQSIDVTTKEGREAAFGIMEDTRESINQTRSDLGSYQIQLASTARNISVTLVNVAAGESQIRDLDFAKESANFSKENIMSQIGSFTHAQANAQAANIAKLFA
jgi:flagellin